MTDSSNQQLSQLLDPSRRPAVTADLSQMVDTTVAAQSGFTGMAIKGALSAARKADPKVVSKGINRLLPEIFTALEPHWADFGNSNSPDFGAFLATRSAEVTNSLLEVADRNADKLNNPAAAKAYKGLRGKANKVVEPQIPQLGKVLQQHM